MLPLQIDGKKLSLSFKIGMNPTRSPRLTFISINSAENKKIRKQRKRVKLVLRTEEEKARLIMKEAMFGGDKASSTCLLALLYTSYDGE